MSVCAVKGLPPSCYYIPSFITPTEEQRLTDEIRKLPESRWTVLSHRRLLSLPSTLTGPAHDTLLAAPLPAYLESIILRLQEEKYFESSPHKAPNHVLINEYNPGEGIMPHEDGPAYSPVTATHGERETTPTWRILQESRSLLVTTGDMYINTLHGISGIQIDTELNNESIINWDFVEDKQQYQGGQAQRQTRISLTLRDVTKVAKLGGALKFMNKR
ncbi:hypothetical protein, variant [Phialophora macrospora]|uniref:Fe2OG dioxygenase domain-containing protein n=1 Tax=Phialophora macrospora TaxID=1851006 RepID=A0A0D2EHM7_9EURO|nr:hypothetical protein, variant [Phialophora macrospora]